MFEEHAYRNEDGTTKGWLLKWTNYVKGYRKRWFVLTDENLSYYRKKTEEDYTQRGTINLVNTIIHTYDNISFVIANKEFKEAYYLKAANTEERNNWVKALEKAKAKAHRKIELTHGLPQTFNNQLKEIILTIDEIFDTRIDSLQKYNNLIVKHGNNLKKRLTEIEKTQINDISTLTTEIKEAEILFQFTSTALINAYVSFIGLAEVQYNKIHSWLWDQVEQKDVLEDIVKQLIIVYSLLANAIQNKDATSLKRVKNFAVCVSQNHKHLEHKTICCSSTEDLTNSCDNTQNVITPFIIDGVESYPSIVYTGGLIPNDVRTLSINKMCAAAPGFKVRENRKTGRRTRIPDKPNRPLNLWSVMKNSIGKDLSRIPMPVNFSEPLSFLQRVAEDFSYSYLLDQAALCVDLCEQLAYLATFTVSCYSTTGIRTAKPFNPLLGETFEWDRTDDLGWRLITEQVSHHPPISAQHCESREWTCWQEFSMTSKFRGKYLMIVPHGISHIVFHKSKTHYSWTKVTTIINNIIIGKLWVDNTGQIEVINHTDSSKCVINFHPYSMFRPDDQKRITGEVMNDKNEVKWIVNGKWDGEITITPVLSTSGKPGYVTYNTGQAKRIWKVDDIQEDSHKYYNFSVFACQLNEMEDDIAPTDSRHRPDQKLMENGNWDEANIVKSALEAKQRAARKSAGYASLTSFDHEATDVAHRTSRTDSTSSSLRERQDLHVHEPAWFKTELDITGRLTYIYNGGYWEAKEKKDWSKCPNIYL